MGGVAIGEKYADFLSLLVLFSAWLNPFAKMRDGGMEGVSGLMINSSVKLNFSVIQSSDSILNVVVVDSLTLEMENHNM